MKFNLPPTKQLLVLTGIYVVLFFSSALITTGLVALKKSVQNSPIASPSQSTLPSPFIPPRTNRTILFIGYGGAGHDGGTLADSLLLINADSQTKKMSYISIPRDTWVTIPTSPTSSEEQKINMSFAIGLDDTRYPNKEASFKGTNGGGNLAKAAVEKVTGIPVDYFISVDFGNFTKAIDTIGGIDVVITAPFDDYFYPVKGLESESCGKSGEEITAISATMSGFLLEKQFTCRYEHLHFGAGTMHMDGATALKFVRSRHSDINGGDFARSARQVSILKAIEDKALSLGALDKLSEFFKQFSSIISTDIDASILEPTLGFLGNPHDYTYQSINLSTENVFTEAKSPLGAYILIPKSGSGAWGTVQQYIKDELNK